MQIANRIKAKGLTKLRFYCQLCQKACRDENGFKCHQTSEGHRCAPIGLEQPLQLTWCAAHLVCSMAAAACLATSPIPLLYMPPCGANPASDAG